MPARAASAAMAVASTLEATPPPENRRIIVRNRGVTLGEFYQQISRRLSHQFGRGVRGVESTAKAIFDPQETLTP